MQDLLRFCATDFCALFLEKSLRDELLKEIQNLTNSDQAYAALKRVSQFYYSELLTEADYQLVYVALNTAAALFKRHSFKTRNSLFGIRKRPTMPKEQNAKAEYMQRRRKLAAKGYTPPQIATHFTQGQLAVLAVIVQEVGLHGHCALVINKLASLAGVCHQTVRRTVQAALNCSHKLLSIQSRPRKGAKNLSNIIKIESAEWLKWIERRFSKTTKPTKKEEKTTEKQRNKLFSSGKSQKCNPMLYTNILNTFSLCLNNADALNVANIKAINIGNNAFSLTNKCFSLE